MNKGVLPGGRLAKVWSFTDVSMQSKEDGPGALLHSILAALRRDWRKLALWIVLCTAVAAIYARSMPPVYTASASLLLEPRRQVVTSARETAAPPALDLNRADSELQVIRSERLLTLVFDSLDLAGHPDLQPTRLGALGAVAEGARRVLARPLEVIAGLPHLLAGGSVAESPAAEQAAATAERPAIDPRRIAFSTFSQRLLARRVGQSYVIEISYSSSDRALAPRVANAAVSAYLLQSVAFKADAARSGAEFIQGRLDTLLAQVRAASDAVRAGTLPASPTPDADARVIGAALEPLAPSAPRKTIITALGAVMGLLSGGIAIVLARSFDRRIRSGEAITRETGLPCLAMIPEAKNRTSLTFHSQVEMDSLVSFRPQDPFSAAVRDLRTSIALACPPSSGDDRRIIALVSWAPNAGCSMLCLNLARLIERSGRPVTVIDADIHGTRAALQPTESATETSLVELLSSATVIDETTFRDLDGVALLPATSVGRQANYFVDFRDPRMGVVLTFARARGDVLIDLPPLSDTAEARALAAAADAVVIVVVEGKTTHDELQEAARMLSGSGANVIGAVLNRSRA